MTEERPRFERTGGSRRRAGQRRGGGRHAARGQIPDLLIWSILATVFCCLPGGIVAIIYSTKANSARATGDLKNGVQYAKTAKTWLFVSLGVGLAVLAIYMLVAVVTVVGGPSY